MAGAVVEINVSEIESLAKKLNAYALSAAQRHGLLESIGDEIIEQTSDRLETGKRDPAGNTWKPWSDKYKKIVERKYPAASMLRREGYLQQSLDREVNDYSVLVGATMEYAAAHQFGYKERNIPARPYLGLSSENIRDLEAAIDSFLGGLSA
jgi:phage virion morphogenesis protein